MPFCRGSTFEAHVSDNAKIIFHTLLSPFLIEINGFVKVHAPHILYICPGQCKSCKDTALTSAERRRPLTTPYHDLQKHLLAIGFKTSSYKIGI